ncbi:MAG: hypothetical protein AAF387_13610 [Pseudomonadota bacterium]
MSEFWERAIKDSERGEIRDGDTRYVMFRTDVIAAMVNQLPIEARAAALESLANAVRTQGGKSLSRYLDMVGGDVEALLKTVSVTAPALGWGKWQLHRTDSTLQLVVEK